ncbi:MAG: glycosyltransferase [Pseudomonadota bacterium]
MNAAATQRSRRITLVLPVRNEAGNVEETLGSLMKSTMLPDEILISDGRSTDSTIAEVEVFAARHPEVEFKIVDNEKLWVGSARNRAIEVCTGEIILIADFGNTFRPNWIEAMAKPFLDDPDVDIVCGLFQPKVTSEFEHCVAVVHMLDDYMLHTMKHEDVVKLVPEVAVPVGMATGITKATWEELNGFPEWLFKGQDKLFGRKAWAKRKNIAIAWDAFVDHHVRSSPKEVFNYLYYYGRGFGQQRLLSNMTRKLIMIYGVFLLLLVAGFFMPVFWLGAALLAAAHIWYFGFRKLFQQMIRPWHWKQAYLLPIALISRDTGSILGHIVGWTHWITKPKLRKLQADYLVGADPKRLRIVSR